MFIQEEKVGRKNSLQKKVVQGQEGTEVVVQGQERTERLEPGLLPWSPGSVHLAMEEQNSQPGSSI